MSQEKLKLITQYDRQRNQYSVLRHNLGEREAQEALQDIAARRFSLFIVNQGEFHGATDPEKCLDCRKDVERTSRLKPKPTFKRRNE